MPRELKRTLILIAGIIFLILGLLGLTLPILQGALFLIIGLILLSIVSKKMRGWIESHTRPYPKIHTAGRKIEKWITDLIGPVDEDNSASGPSPEQS